MLKNLCFRGSFFVGVFFLIFGSHQVLGHEAGSPFSGAIGEPVIVHHAHIEDEQFLNLASFDGLRGEGEKRSAFSSTLELARDWTGEFRLGSEIFIPFSDTGTLQNEYGLGDIELQLVKYAFLNEPERILTGAVGIKLPTGDTSVGLGSGQTMLEALLFLDKAHRNWYFGLNAEFASSVAGETSSEVELGAVVSRYFIRETGEGMAPTIPDQFLVPILSLEMLSQSVLAGEEQGLNNITLLPSVQLWHPASDWIFLLGVQFPVSSERENDFAVHFQVGNHFDWDSLFK